MARRRPLPGTVRQRSATPASRLPATSLHDPPASRLPTARPQPLFTTRRPLRPPDSGRPRVPRNSRPSAPASRPSAQTPRPAISILRPSSAPQPELPPATEAPSRNRSPLPQPELPPPATGVLASPQPSVPGTKKRGTPQRHSPPSDNNPVPAATCRPRCSLSARPAP